MNDRAGLRRGWRGWPLLPALVLGGSLPFAAAVLTAATGTPMAFNAAYLFGIALFNVVFYAALLTAGLRFLGRTSFGVLYGLLGLFVSLYLSAYTYHFLLFGQLIGDPSISAVLDSNPQEAFEFLRWATDGRRLFLAVLAAVLAAVALALTRPSPASRPSLRTGLVALALVGLMLPFGVWHWIISHYNPSFFLPRSIAYNLVHRAAVQRLQATVEGGVRADEVTGPPERAVTHILIIGESTTRRHMSLYGYERDTTPNLNRLTPELYVARDVCSSRGATVPALQELLTFATREDLAPLFDKPSLLQILKAVGFRTWWLSNHQLYGKWDNWSAILSGPADTRLFVNRVGVAGASLDEQLIGPFEAALADPAPRKFVVVHLLGTHADYALRYPPAFERFVDTSLPPTPRRLQGAEIDRYNAYDNAVLYTDHMVEQIIERARKAGESVSVTFLSDHGEALGETSDFLTHIDGPTPRQVYEIPLAMWVSPTLRSRLGARVDELRANLSRPYQTDSFINTLLDLYGIEHAGHVSERSLFAHELRIPARYCDTLP